MPSRNNRVLADILSLTKSKDNNLALLNLHNNVREILAQKRVGLTQAGKLQLLVDQIADICRQENLGIVETITFNFAKEIDYQNIIEEAEAEYNNDDDDDDE